MADHPVLPEPDAFAVLQWQYQEQVLKWSSGVSEGVSEMWRLSLMLVERSMAEVKLIVATASRQLKLSSGKQTRQAGT